jgi:hypothetical protein
VNEEPHPKKMTSQHLTPDKRQWAHKRITRDTRNWSARLTGPEASWRTVRQAWQTVRQKPSASNIPLSRNLSNYSNNLESILDVYDVRHLGYSTWFFKKTSHKMTMLTNSIQTIKRIQDFHKQGIQYFENHFVVKRFTIRQVGVQHFIPNF